jgi:hypothetical protein
MFSVVVIEKEFVKDYVIFGYPEKFHVIAAS